MTGLEKQTELMLIADLIKQSQVSHDRQQGEIMKFVKLSSTAITPTRGTEGSAGLDLYADQDVLVSSGASVMMSTGIAVEIPAGNVGLVAIRSSVGRSGVSLANSVGVIDSDYRGEIKLCLVYTAGNGGHYVRKGQAIAQLIVMPVLPVELMQVDALSNTDRGDGGFGSTGQ
jgi:dUTP pyrophosphatase